MWHRSDGAAGRGERNPEGAVRRGAAAGPRVLLSVLQLRGHARAVPGGGEARGDVGADADGRRRRAAWAQRRRNGGRSVM